MSEGTECAAIKQADGRTACERCALAWDDGDTRPPCSPLTYARLALAAIAEAERIEQSQDALIECGSRKFRYQPALARALELRKLASLVDKFKAMQARGAG
jgi:hypothetical protein